MVKSNKTSQTFPQVSTLTQESNDSKQTLSQCAIVIGNNRHKTESCSLCFKPLCQKCFRNQELFSSILSQTIQCPHCQAVEEFKNLVLYASVNTLQLILLLSLFPIVAFALALQRTEQFIQEIERKVDNIVIILIVNLFFSIPIYIGQLLISLFLAPCKIFKSFFNAMSLRDFCIIKRVFSQQ